MTRPLYVLLAALCAVAGTSTPTRAQFEDVGYDEAAYTRDVYDARGDAARYDARRAAVAKENGELEAELARSRERYQQALESNAAGGCGCNTGCCLQPANWFDPCCCGPTVAAYVSGDAWRDVGDGSFQNDFGNRFGLDVTWNVGSSGVRGHLGGSYGLYDYHGRSGRGIGTTGLASAEQQIFLTAGVYRRGCDCGDWTWAAAYDFFSDNHYGVSAEYVELHQARFLLGRMMNRCNEFGVWGAFGTKDDEIGFDGTLKVQDQVNLYWRRYWDFGGETMLYAGVAQANLPAQEPQVFGIVPPPPPELDDDFTEFVVGLRGIAPLTCNVGLVGGFHYVIPSASGGLNMISPRALRSAATEESWNVTFGVIWVRGCNLPVLPGADNGWLGRRLMRGRPQLL